MKKNKNKRKANSLSMFFLLMLVFGMFSPIKAASDPNKDGYDLGSFIRSNAVSNTDTFNDRILKPSTSDQAYFKPLVKGYWCKDNQGNVIKEGFKTIEECQQYCQTGTCSEVKVKAYITCPSNKEGIRVTTNPSNFGEASFNIRIDLDADNNYDISFTTERISQVCTNGFITCTPGTSNNCHYYYWGVPHKCDDKNIAYNSYEECKAHCNSSCSVVSNTINYHETTVKDLLGVCECTNSACSNSILTNFKKYGPMLIGGIIGHLTRELNMSVNTPNIDESNLEITYTTQNTKDCYGSSTGNSDIENKIGTANTDNYSKYYNLGEIPEDDVQQEVSRQSQIEDSVYSLTVKDPNKLNIYSCNIREVIEFTGIEYATDGGCKVSSSYCTGGEEDMGNGTYKCYFSPILKDCGHGNNKSHTYNVNLCGKWHLDWYIPDDERVLIKINGEEIINVEQEGDAYSGSCEGDTTTGTTSGRCKKSHTPSNSLLSGYFFIIDPGTCYTTPTTHLYTYIRKYEGVQNKQYGTCIPPSNDCVIKDEWVCDQTIENWNQASESEKLQHCVKTISNKAYTGNSLPSYCYQKSADSFTYTICRDGNTISISGKTTSGYVVYVNQLPGGWNYIHREYECPHQLDDIEQQAQDALQSTTDNMADMVIDGQNQKVTYGNTTLEANTGNINYNECTLSCRVEAEDINGETSIISDETRPTGIDSKQVQEIPCDIDSNGTPTCPVPEGFHIVKDCRCSDNFAEAVSSIQAAIDASKDIICSSSPP